ncbi:MAG TPA: FHA domain-containing protein [Lacipirellulaceae bacterium]|nr:FHA domain-containing protein [Lacipirellulaceae bacterium]
MELKLVVLAGAKQGLEIPLKKEKFLIGRAKECALRAGSEAISRRHCAIVRASDRVTVRDLGSRNGTFVNDERIEKEVPLSVGDELRVGPLKFRIAAMSSAPAAEAKSSAPVPAPKSLKKPPVKDVAGAVQRTIDKAEGGTTEDDVSRWLLGVPDPKSEDTLKETRTMRLEETTLNRRTIGDVPAVENVALDESEESAVDDPAAEQEAAEKSSAWSFFKRGKSSAGKKKPGKLPPRPDAPSKDSREAAADILREMTRRR